MERRPWHRPRRGDGRADQIEHQIPKRVVVAANVGFRNRFDRQKLYDFIQRPDSASHEHNQDDQSSAPRNVGSEHALQDVEADQGRRSEAKGMNKRKEVKKPKKEKAKPAVSTPSTKNTVTISQPKSQN